MVDGEEKELMSPQDDQHKEPLLGKASRLSGISTAKDVPIGKGIGNRGKTGKNRC